MQVGCVFDAKEDSVVIISSSRSLSDRALLQSSGVMVQQEYQT